MVYIVPVPCSSLSVFLYKYMKIINLYVERMKEQHRRMEGYDFMLGKIFLKAQRASMETS